MVIICATLLGWVHLTIAETSSSATVPMLDSEDSEENFSNLPENPEVLRLQVTHPLSLIHPSLVSADLLRFLGSNLIPPPLLFLLWLFFVLDPPGLDRHG